MSDQRAQQRTKSSESRNITSQTKETTPPELSPELTQSGAALQRAHVAPGALTSSDVISLQRTIGNQAVQRMLSGKQTGPNPSPTGQMVIQPKLVVGPAQDRYEQEADNVAQQVMRMPMPMPARAIAQRDALKTQTKSQSPLKSPTPSITPFNTRQRRDETKLQASSAAPGTVGMEGGPVGGDIESSIRHAKGGGKALSDTVRTKMEAGIGADFSNVRVHVGGQADTLNRSLNARAFTTGSDIFFKQGAYSPGSADGQHLLAHELTHVVQQTGGAKVQRKGITSRQNKDVAPTMTIQRRMNFAMTDLGGSLSFGAKVKGFFGSESTFAQLKKELASYFNADGPAEELASLQILKQLANQWITRHDKDKKKDATKDNSIKNLITEIDLEIPKVQKQISDDANEQDEYIRKIEAKSLKYVTTSGLGIAKKMKGWHSGTDTMGQQSLDVNELTKTHGLTLAEATAIGVYTADDYKYMNPAMAGNEGWMRAMLPRTGFSNLNTSKEVQSGVTDQHVQEAMTEGKLHGKIAKAGMKKLPDWTGTTFRGLALTPDEFKTNYPLNGLSVFPAFSSTSLQETVSRGFARREATGGKVGILLRLHLTKGKDIAKLSDAPGEAEILLMPGATFKVEKIKEEDYKGTKMYVLDLKQQK